MSLDRGARRIAIGRPRRAAADGGPRLPHGARPRPDFTWQENFQVRGDSSAADGGWALVPHKLVGGFELPKESELARYRRNLSKSVRFYKTRQARPQERSAPSVARA